MYALARAYHAFMSLRVRTAQGTRTHQRTSVSASAVGRVGVKRMVRLFVETESTALFRPER